MARDATKADSFAVTDTSLWLVAFASLGSNLAWAAHLNVSYFLVQPVCQTGGTWALHVTSAVLLLIAWSSLATAFSLFRRSGTPFRLGLEGRNGWQGFIGVFGIASGLLLSLAIITQWVPMFFIDPCG